MGEPPDCFNTNPPEFSDIKLFTAEKLTEMPVGEDEDVDVDSSGMQEEKDGMQDAG